MSGKVDRHERERANWILAHESTHSLSDRRRANDLKRRAARLDRAESGAAESSFHEGRIPWVGSRFISHGEDSKEKGFRSLTLFFVLIPLTALVAGPALALAGALYGLAWWWVPSKGRVLRGWPFYLAAVAAGAVGWLLVRIAPFSVILLWPRHLELYVPMTAAVYAWAQTVLGLVLAGVRVRQGGWNGVRAAKAKKTPSMPAPAVPKAAKAPAIPTAKSGDGVQGTGSGESADRPPKPKVKAPAIPEPSAPEPEPLWDDEEEIEWEADAAPAEEEGARK
ncbi:hypothetical protein [Brachybacterium sp. NPDC056505]|uniref:hypothetical protein n=1 Tax=Brachybacterium sp. NPDC056505 TaxID=3345843 RepID=UPI003670127D